jgi:nitrate reductase NapE
MPHDANNSTATKITSTEAVHKQQELKLFIFIVVILFPLASVALIGAYGLIIWLLQIMARH